jgi:hypothetical protein
VVARRRQRLEACARLTESAEVPRLLRLLENGLDHGEVRGIGVGALR